MKNCASDCWWSVPTAVEQSCQVFFSFFLTYFGKVLTGFLCKYFNYHWLFQFRIKTINNYLHIFIILVLPTFEPFKNLTKLNKVGIVGKPLVSGTSLYIYCQKRKKWNYKKPRWIFSNFQLFYLKVLLRYAFVVSKSFSSFWVRIYIFFAQIISWKWAISHSPSPSTLSFFS